MEGRLEPFMPNRAHDSTRDPETMTPGERRGEIAAILAGGLVRAVRASREWAPESAEISPEPAPSGLDLSPDLRLSVAQRPAG